MLRINDSTTETVQGADFALSSLAEQALICRKGDVARFRRTAHRSIEHHGAVYAKAYDQVNHCLRHLLSNSGTHLMVFSS